MPALLTTPSSFDDPAGRNCLRHGLEIGHGYSAALLDFLGHFFGWSGTRSRTVGRSAGIVDHHLGALSRAEQRDLPPDAAPGAGDNDGFAFE
jgi:hypothetical protein